MSSKREQSNCTSDNNQAKHSAEDRSYNANFKQHLHEFENNKGVLPKVSVQRSPQQFHTVVSTQDFNFPESEKHQFFCLHLPQVGRKNSFLLQTVDLVQ